MIGDIRGGNSTSDGQLSFLSPHSINYFVGSGMIMETPEENAFNPEKQNIWAAWVKGLCYSIHNWDKKRIQSLLKKENWEL